MHTDFLNAELNRAGEFTAWSKYVLKMNEKP